MKKVPKKLVKGGKVKKYFDGGGVDSLTADQKVIYDSFATPQEKADYLAKLTNAVIPTIPTSTTTPKVLKGTMDTSDVGTNPKDKKNIDPTTGIPYVAAGQFAGNLVQEAVPEGKRGENIVGKEVAKDALKGAGYGAAVGSVVPVIGTGIGAAVGAVGGAAYGLYEGLKKKKTSDSSYTASDQALAASRMNAPYKKGGKVKPVVKTKPVSKDDQVDLFPNVIDRQDEEEIQEKKKGGTITKEKAAKILHDGTVYGKPLTDKQRKFMGAKSQGLDGGGAVGGGGDAGGGGTGTGGAMNTGGAGFIGTLGPPEHSKKKKGLLFALGGETPANPVAPLANAISTKKTGAKAMDMVYASPEGKYHLMSTTSQGPKYSEIDEAKFKTYPQAQVGNYNKFVNPLSKSNKSFANAKTTPMAPPLMPGKAKGGQIKGAGGPKDDKIPMKAAEGSFVVPAENADKALALRKQYLATGGYAHGGKVPIKVSNGEHMFTPEEVATLKSKGVDLNSLAPNADTKLDKAKGGGIHIKPSKVGTLHTAVGVPQGEKIPASKLSIKEGDSPVLKKKKQFAINAKKWKHEDGGIVGLLGQEKEGYAKGGKVSKSDIDRSSAILQSQSDTLDAEITRINTKGTQLEKQITLPNLLKKQEQLRKNIELAKDPANYEDLGTGLGYSFSPTAKKSTTTPPVVDALSAIGKRVYSTPEEAQAAKDATSKIEVPSSNQPASNKKFVNTQTIPKGGVGSVQVSGTKKITSTGDKTTQDTATSNAGLKYTAGEGFDFAAETAKDAEAKKLVGPTVEADAALKTPDAPLTEPTATTPPVAPKEDISKMDKALALGQVGIGLVQTMGYKRPTYTIPKEVQAAYQTASQEATYGLDPVAKAEIQNDINAKTNTSVGLVAGVAGGDRALAFRMIQGLDQTAGRGLISMYAQDAAAKRAKQQQVYGLAGVLGNYKNFAYQQDMNKFMQNQKAGADLLQAGISNLAGSYQEDRAVNAQAKRDALYGGRTVNIPSQPETPLPKQYWETSGSSTVPG